MRPTLCAVLLAFAASAALLLSGGCVARIGNRSSLSSDGTGEIVNSAPNVMQIRADGESTDVQTVGSVSRSRLDLPWDVDTLGNPVFASVNVANGGVTSREIVTKFLGAPLLIRAGDCVEAEIGELYDPATGRRVAKNVKLRMDVAAATKAMEQLSSAYAAYSSKRDEASGAALARLMQMYETIAPSAVSMVKAALAASGIPDPSLVSTLTGGVR